MIDIQLEYTNKQLKNKDLKVMKILHDIKNPVQALYSVINDIELKPEHMRRLANADLEDMNEIIDNLKTEFKSRHNMDFKEDERLVNTQEFLELISRSHIRLATNGNNSFEIATEDQIPAVIKIRKITVARICNNLISNALKHTNDGLVSVSFKIANIEELTDKSYYHKGASYIDNLKYYMFEVLDNGKGIVESKINKIFSLKYTDQENENYDGIGLGLNICQYLCSQSGSFIRYLSKPGEITIFRYFYPVGNTSHLKRTSQRQSQNSYISITLTTKDIKKDSKNYIHPHVCGEIIIAEDNPSILKKYENYYNKHNLNYKAFYNGKTCFDYIKTLNCSLCKKHIVMTDLSMPYKDGVELATSIKSLKYAKKFYLILVSAEEYNNKDNLFNEMYIKPIAAKKLGEIYYNHFKIIE